MRQAVHRITPAGAGKSLAGRGMTARSRDHPRGCGEKGSINYIWGLVRGSPPRVRGKVEQIFLDWDHRGITPAGAGKSSLIGNLLPGSGDHPRGCGEKAQKGAAAATQLGSPPRVRGKARELRDKAALIGITPAGAGKSHNNLRWLCCCRDHPRGCGEKSPNNLIHSGNEGSPPRVRGKVVQQRKLRVSVRITPAGAGKRPR